MTRVTTRPKVSYLTLLAASDRQGMTTYFDVVVFATQGLAVPAEGASVSVTGTLGRRKPQSGTAWTTELIARAIEAGDEGLTPMHAPRGVTREPAADLTDSKDDNIPF